MSDPKCPMADDCTALYQSAKEQWREFVKLMQHADAMAEALDAILQAASDFNKVSQSWRWTGGSVALNRKYQDGDDVLTAYQKDFPK